MKVKVSELTGLALDYAVAKCEGFNPQYDMESHGTKWYGWWISTSKYEIMPKYSTSWQQGGPIIEREKINLHFCCDLRDINGKYIHASMNTNLFHGYCKGHDTPLIAAMRCYVASKMGEEIEIPEELCQG